MELSYASMVNIVPNSRPGMIDCYRARTHTRVSVDLRSYLSYDFILLVRVQEKDQDGIMVVRRAQVSYIFSYEYIFGADLSAVNATCLRAVQDATRIFAGRSSTENARRVLGHSRSAFSCAEAS